MPLPPEQIAEFQASVWDSMRRQVHEEACDKRFSHETMQTPIVEPVDAGFVVLIDTAEQHPFPFTNLVADANQKYRPLVVRTKMVNLGRHPHSLGDYSIEGFYGRCHIERKSVEDAQATVLGWGKNDSEGEVIDMGRRKRFEKELENLAKIDAGIVLVEGTYEDCLNTMRSHGAKSAQENAKIFNRSVQSYMQDAVYKGCWWHFAGSRRTAERFAFQYLRRFWKKHKNELKQQQ